MRLLRPLLLILTASVGVAALVGWSTDVDRFRAQNSDTETLLSALFEPGEQPQPPTASVSRSASEQLPTPVPAVPPATATLDPQVRIALLSQNPLDRVSLEGGAQCTNQAGSPVGIASLNRLLAVQRPGLLRCGGQRGSVLVNGRAYEGIVHLINRGKGWMAINQINLERYVASVVGAEMPSHWNAEALKAQAIAARSYGLVHMIRPADPDWNLGDTSRWQAYAGRASSTDSTVRATDATRGLVLSFKGGLVESLYASTQAISDEAHGHLGASMSQHGAQQLAQRGLRFNEILGRYYAGASLARIRSDGE